MSSVPDYVASDGRRRAEVLAPAERDAIATGKEPRTLAEYASHLHVNEPWEDGR